LGTAPHAPVTAKGCAIDQLCPCAAPLGRSAWAGHSEYTACVRGAAHEFAQHGAITKTEKRGILKAAAKTACGKQQPASSSTTTTTTTNTTTTTGVCSFKRTPCSSDAECGIQGVCSPDMDCRHSCAAGCPDGTSCFTAACTGDICVGCGG